MGFGRPAGLKIRESDLGSEERPMDRQPGGLSQNTKNVENQNFKIQLAFAKTHSTIRAPLQKAPRIPLLQATNNRSGAGDGFAFVIFGFGWLAGPENRQAQT